LQYGLSTQGFDKSRTKRQTATHQQSSTKGNINALYFNTLTAAVVFNQHVAAHRNKLKFTAAEKEMGLGTSYDNNGLRHHPLLSNPLFYGTMSL